MSIQTLFVANRGEIAVRIIRAAKSLGIATVQACSEADTDSLAARLADKTVLVGPAKAEHSYLDIDKMIAAALSMGCDAVHPGYGFLAENSAFAQAVVDAGLRWVGPTAQTIEHMGDKVRARAAAQSAGVPTVPGSTGRVEGLDDTVAIAAEIGYPVMIKASAGGGGRGIRVANDEQELRQFAPQAAAEAKAAFGDGGLFVERALQNARHIEVQILADGEHAIHLWERECSLQRRRQKVWEEAPAAILDQPTREALCASAVALAKGTNYSGAGTVEYLFDSSTGEFFFLEMNTRVQVEHPITEMITGVDIVAEMLRIAGGETLRLQQKDIRREGHSIEVRINAEDPTMMFMPCPGTVDKLTLPSGEGVRFDSMLYQGYTVPPYYDSLLAKLIVHAADRGAAIERLAAALDSLEIGGIATTIPLHKALAADADVRSGQVHTQFLEPWLESQDLTVFTRAKETGEIE